VPHENGLDGGGASPIEAPSRVPHKVTAVDVYPANLVLPTEFWISIDPELPLAQWNKQIGSYASAAWSMATVDAGYRERYVRGEVDYLMFVPSPTFDAGALSPYHHGIVARYIVEYNAELARRQLDPTLPSRLSAVYAFGSKKDAVREAKRAGRPKWEVFAFSLVDDPLTRVARVNMNLISLMRLGSRVASWDPPNLDRIWGHYWSGAGNLQLELPSGVSFARKTHDSGVVWEYLIEGRLDVLSQRH
jgi:hypothetical protein